MIRNFLISALSYLIFFLVGLIGFIALALTLCLSPVVGLLYLIYYFLIYPLETSYRKFKRR
nr:MAG TPA: hypothetical protein [Caudoviricetes sp.]